MMASFFYRFTFSLFLASIYLSGFTQPEMGEGRAFKIVEYTNDVIKLMNGYQRANLSLEGQLQNLNGEIKSYQKGQELGARLNWTTGLDAEKQEELELTTKEPLAIDDSATSAEIASTMISIQRSHKQVDSLVQSSNLHLDKKKYKKDAFAALILNLEMIEEQMNKLEQDRVTLMAIVSEESFQADLKMLNQHPFGHYLKPMKLSIHHARKLLDEFTNEPQNRLDAIQFAWREAKNAGDALPSENSELSAVQLAAYEPFKLAVQSQILPTTAKVLLKFKQNDVPYLQQFYVSDMQKAQAAMNDALNAYNQFVDSTRK